MAHTSPAPHSPLEVPKRPKGILKNSASYQYASPKAVPISPPNDPTLAKIDAVVSEDRPAAPERGMSEKELVLMNTELNAGAACRRSSLNPRGNTDSRRESMTAHAAAEDHRMRLTWDEANLYLNEGQMGGRMKIDEPKTPYVGSYEEGPDEEPSALDPDGLAVDELEMKLGPGMRRRSGSGGETDIPGLDLGAPEVEPESQRDSDSDRRVVVAPAAATDGMDVDERSSVSAGHGEDREADMTDEEREKHRKFEEMRKKHYEMKNVKGLLGHPEELDQLDDEDEERRK